jgi:hypothetical protein
LNRQDAKKAKNGMRGLAHEFRLTDIFSFFSWGEIRAISPQRVAVSLLAVAG